jgi:hypothetical protein
MQSIRASTLIPRGFVAEEAVNDLDSTLITVRPASATSQCPVCADDQILGGREVGFPMTSRAAR